MLKRVTIIREWCAREKKRKKEKTREWDERMNANFDERKIRRTVCDNDRGYNVAQL